MSTTERDELAALLPPPNPEIRVPAADARRNALVREVSTAPTQRRRFDLGGWTAPASAAAALVLVVALTAGVGMFVGRSGTGPASAGHGAVDELLDRIDAADGISPGAVFGEEQFFYTQTLVVRGKSGRTTRTEQWISADGSRVGRLVTDLGGVAESEKEVPPSYPANDPSGRYTLDAVAAHPTLWGLAQIRGTSPEDLLAAVRRDPTVSGDAEAFARVREALASGGLLVKALRSLLYRTAALVPRVRVVTKKDATGRAGAALVLGTGDRTQQIVVDPYTGATLALQGPENERETQAYYIYGVVDRPGIRPVENQAPNPGSMPSGNSMPLPIAGPTSVRDVDFANGDWELPLDLSKRPEVRAGLDSGSGGPIGHFVDGISRISPQDEWPLQLRIDPSRYPVGYLRPTAEQVDGHPARDIQPETAIVVIEIRPTEPGRTDEVTYAVIGFTGTTGALFPGPQTLVALITGGPGPVVTAKGDTVTVDPRTGAAPQRYVRSGIGFAGAP